MKRRRMLCCYVLDKSPVVNLHVTAPDWLNLNIQFSPNEAWTYALLNFHVTTPDWSNTIRVFSVRYDLSIVLSCCNLHGCRVLVDVIVCGSTGKHRHTLTTKVCGYYCKYQLSLKKKEGRTWDS